MGSEQRRCRRELLRTSERAVDEYPDVTEQRDSFSECSRDEDL